jgi:hypothetical protein
MMPLGARARFAAFDTAKFGRMLGEREGIDGELRLPGLHAM